METTAYNLKTDRKYFHYVPPTLMAKTGTNRLCSLFTDELIRKSKNAMLVLVYFLLSMHLFGIILNPFFYSIRKTPRPLKPDFFFLNPDLVNPGKAI